jgi:hypothetical protein
MDGDLDFIRDLLLDCDCVWLRDRIRHFLGDDYGPHVFLLVVLMFITAFQNPAVITLLFKTPLLQFRRTKYKQHPQQRAYLAHNNIQNADDNAVENVKMWLTGVITGKGAAWFIICGLF